MGKTSNETAVSGSIWEAEETSLPPAFGLDEAADNEQRKLAHAGGRSRKRELRKVHKDGGWREAAGEIDLVTDGRRAAIKQPAEDRCSSPAISLLGARSGFTGALSQPKYSFCKSLS